MSFKLIHGDLFDHLYSYNHPTIIAHVCNNKGKWGSGFVIPLAKYWPYAKKAYIKWHKGYVYQSNTSSDGQLLTLGQTQMVTVCDKTYTLNNSIIIVANMIAQTLGGNRPLYYNHLARCMDQVANSAEISAKAEIICPMFGSGLAGGNWDFIRELIEDCWISRGIDVTVYSLEG